MERCCI